MTVLPQALKEWRRVAQISQATLASRAGVSEGLIAQIETGRRQPGVQNALAIAEVLGVPLNAIALVHVPLDNGRAA